MKYVLAINKYANMQNVLLDNIITFIFAFYFVHQQHVIQSVKKDSTLHVRNSDGISVPSQLVKLRFRIIRPQEKEKLSYLLPGISFCSFFAVLDFTRRILAIINTLFRENSERIAAQPEIISCFARFRHVSEGIALYRLAIIF